MMELKASKYLHSRKRFFEPLSAGLSVALMAGVLLAVLNSHDSGELKGALLFDDHRSLFFVIGGTFGCLLFQFDLLTLLQSLWLALCSLVRNPLREVNALIAELDEAIIKGSSLRSLREGAEVSGELLNDIVHMLREKLFYEEIEALVVNRIATAFLARKTAVILLHKGSRIAPALGLLGTVIGLVGVLQTLEDPANIGPAMSLALMTTAFGSLLGSFVFTPLAGRLEHHNALVLESHQLMMNRIRVLLQREERSLNPALSNKKVGGGDAA